MCTVSNVVFAELHIIIHSLTLQQASHYHPDLTEVVSEGIKNAFRDILQKGVLL